MRDIKFRGRRIKMSDIEKLKTYTYKQIEEMDKEQLKQEFKKIQDIAKDGNEIILSLNKMKQRYKIALFMIVRNSQVMPKGIELGKSDKEINKMAYETMCEVLTMIDFKRAEEIYKQGKKAHEED